jgi:rfaE bifunctional protein kinase chain/domain
MQNVKIDRANELLALCRGKTIAVIGDVMLDRYFWGNVSRISPESPVPVIDLEKETYHLGGSANVANNLMSLGVTPLMCGVVGKDSSGSKFLEIAREMGIDTDGLYIDKGRPTTVKTRIIGNNQQIARLDREVRDYIPAEGKDYILKSLSNVSELAGIIFEDYNKGTISKGLIKDVIDFAKSKEIPVFVDPKFEFFFDYQGADVFKPNKKEACQALRVEIDSRSEVIEAGQKLMSELNCKNVLLTLGEGGMMLFEENGDISSVPTRARRVADVSGAGDTAIATLSAMIVAGATVKEAATLANYAAGTVCDEPGIVSISPEMLINTILKNNHKKVD